MCQASLNTIGASLFRNKRSREKYIISNLDYISIHKKYSLLQQDREVFSSDSFCQNNVQCQQIHYFPSVREILCPVLSQRKQIDWVGDMFEYSGLEAFFLTQAVSPSKGAN